MFSWYGYYGDRGNIQNITIPNGKYTLKDLAKYLQNKLTQNEPNDWVINYLSPDKISFNRKSGPFNFDSSTLTTFLGIPQNEQSCEQDSDCKVVGQICFTELNNNTCMFSEKQDHIFQAQN